MKLRAFNPLACVAIDSVTQLIRVGAADFRVSADTTLCPGTAVSLVASGGTRYTWTANATLSGLTSATVLAKPTAPTTYTVTIANDEGCSIPKTIRVNIDNSFQARFGLTTSAGCAEPTIIQTVNQSVNADRYVWAMGNGDTLRTTTPDGYRYPQSGRYTITLTAYGKGGCINTTSQPVIIENLDKVPNVITANNDGKNEVFDLGISGAKLDIYNRWGLLLYQSDNYANDWGRHVGHGTYFYLMTTPGGQTCKGWLEVLE